MSHFLCISIILSLSCVSQIHAEKTEGSSTVCESKQEVILDYSKRQMITRIFATHLAGQELRPNLIECSSTSPYLWLLHSGGIYLLCYEYGDTVEISIQFATPAQISSLSMNVNGASSRNFSLSYYNLAYFNLEQSTTDVVLTHSNLAPPNFQNASVQFVEPLFVTEIIFKMEFLENMYQIQLRDLSFYACFDYCYSSPCLEGTCENLQTGYKCLCQENATGINCESICEQSPWSEWDSCIVKDCVVGSQTRIRNIAWESCSFTETRSCQVEDKCPKHCGFNNLLKVNFTERKKLASIEFPEETDFDELCNDVDPYNVLNGSGSALILCRPTETKHLYYSIVLTFSSVVSLVKTTMFAENMKRVELVLQTIDSTSLNFLSKEIHQDSNATVAFKSNFTEAINVSKVTLNFFFGSPRIRVHNLSLSVCDSNVTEDDYCRNEPCPGGSLCENSPTGYSCLCSAGYTGADCQDDVDECLMDTQVAICGENEACNNTIGSYVCVCADGYERSLIACIKPGVNFEKAELKDNDKPAALTTMEIVLVVTAGMIFILSLLIIPLFLVKKKVTRRSKSSKQSAHVMDYESVTTSGSTVDNTTYISKKSPVQINIIKPDAAPHKHRRALSIKQVEKLQKMRATHKMKPVMLSSKIKVVRPKKKYSLKKIQENVNLKAEKEDNKVEKVKQNTMENKDTFSGTISKVKCIKSMGDMSEKTTVIKDKNLLAFLSKRDEQKFREIKIVDNTDNMEHMPGMETTDYLEDNILTESQLMYQTDESTEQFTQHQASNRIPLEQELSTESRETLRTLRATALRSEAYLADSATSAIVRKGNKKIDRNEKDVLSHSSLNKQANTRHLSWQPMYRSFSDIVVKSQSRVNFKSDPVRIGHGTFFSKTSQNQQKFPESADNVKRPEGSSSQEFTLPNASKETLGESVKSELSGNWSVLYTIDETDLE